MTKFYFALRVCFRFVGVGTRRSIATRRTQNQCRDSQRCMRPQPTFHQLLFVSAVARTTRSPSLSSLSQVRAVHSSCHLWPWAAPSSDSHPPLCVRACALPHSRPACMPPEIGAAPPCPSLSPYSEARKWPPYRPASKPPRPPQCRFLFTSYSEAAEATRSSRRG